MALPAPDPGALVLVTGASAGIGEQLARQLARRGHNLALVARREAELAALAAELHDAHGVSAHVLPCDLGDAAARAQLVEQIRARVDFVAGVCNNAGFGSFGRFHELDLEREALMVQVNVVALHELTGEFLAEMVRRGEGAILNVASIAGYQPIPGNATYAATKAFVQSFSEAIHAELAGTGVSVTTLNPGPVHTEFGTVAEVADAERRLPGFATVAPEDVAASAVQAMERGKRTVVPGLVTKALGLGGRFAPRTVLLPAAARATGNSLLNPPSR